MLTGTEHFSVQEALGVSGGSIPDEFQDNAQQTLEWLEAGRQYFLTLGIDRPWILTALFRTAAHNATIPGHASNSEHLQGLGADFVVVGITNDQVLQLCRQGVLAGAIPTYHQLITYKTDHHVHVGLAGSEWGADQQNLQETAIGQYTTLSDDDIAAIPPTSAVQEVTEVAKQSVTVARAYPIQAAALVLALFLPAVLNS